MEEVLQCGQRESQLQLRNQAENVAIGIADMLDESLRETGFLEACRNML